jgi:hypothetical protein
VSEPAQVHRLRLLDILESAVREIGSIDARLKPEWESRLAQVRSDLVLSEAMQRWLNNHADYWQPKDREYAAYVRHLAGSYRPAIDIPQ